MSTSSAPQRKRGLVCNSSSPPPPTGSRNKPTTPPKRWLWRGGDEGCLGGDGRSVVGIFGNGNGWVFWWGTILGVVVVFVVVGVTGWWWFLW